MVLGIFFVGLCFEVVFWSIVLDGLDVLCFVYDEFVFGLLNGYVGWCGNFDEGEFCGVVGSYLNGVFEEYLMLYVEEGYGYLDFGQIVINVQNGQFICFLVDDELFDVWIGEFVYY